MTTQIALQNSFTFTHTFIKCIYVQQIHNFFSDWLTVDHFYVGKYNNQGFPRYHQFTFKFFEDYFIKVQWKACLDDMVTI